MAPADDPRTVGAPRQLEVGGDRASWVRDDVLILPDGAQLVSIHVADAHDLSPEHLGDRDPRCLWCSRPHWRHSQLVHRRMIDAFLEPIR